MLNSFISYLRCVEGKPETTCKMYEYDIKGLLDFLQERKIKLKNVRLKDLYDYMIYLTEKGLKSITRARICSSIRVFFTYLQNYQGLKNNPAVNLHKPKIDKKEVDYLTFDESIKLMNTSKEQQGRNHERNVAIITLFMNLGIRLSELVAINIEDIRDNRIIIKGKGQKERTLYLNNNCIKTIKNYIGERQSGALFISEQKKRISRRSVQYIIKKAIQEAGLNEHISCHKLRHSCATNMYQSGIDIRLLQKILGHEHISTTEIYIHVRDNEMKEAFNRIGGLYENEKL